ncbi:MAG TPA: AAA family ATPase [Pseudonocardiaceae bacterium]
MVPSSEHPSDTTFDRSHDGNEGRANIPGREAVLRLLTPIALGQRPSGTGFVMVAGGFGTGRSTLLAALAERAGAAGALVLRAEATRAETGFPLGVVRQLFEMLLDQSAGRAQGERAALWQDISAHARRLAETHDQRPVDEQAIWHRLYRFAAGLAGDTPVLFAVDDLHLADPESLRWLAYLARRVDRLPVTLVATITTGAESPELAALTGRAYRYVLGALDRAGTGELVRARLRQEPSDALVRACHERTGGNPLQLVELLRTVTDGGVRTIDPAADLPAGIGSAELGRAMLDRLVSIGPDAERLVTAVTVVGACDVATAAALAEMDVRVVRDLMRVLAEAHLLASADRVAPVSAFMRHSLAMVTSHVRQDDVHRAAAIVLRARRGRAEEIAAHLVRTTTPIDEAWAIRVLRVAATNALATGDRNTARDCLARILVERPNTSANLVELGVAELTVDVDAAIAHLTDAVRVADEVDAAAGAAAWLAGALLERDRSADALSVLDDAAAKTGADRTDLLDQLRDYRLSVSTWAFPSLMDDSPRGRLDKHPAVAAFGASLGRADNDRVRRVAHAALDEAATGRSLCEHHLASNQVCASLALLHIEACEQVRARADLQLARAIHSGQPLVVTWTHAVRALAELGLGRHEDAMAAARLCMRASEHSGRRNTGADLASATLVRCLTELGDHDGAREAMRRHGFADPQPVTWGGNQILFSRGCFHLGAGEPRQALADFLECGQRLDRWGTTNPAVLPWRSRAAVAMALLGDRDSAIGLATEEVALARERDVPRTLGAALLVHAVLGGTTGSSVAEAIALLHDHRMYLDEDHRVIAMTGHRHTPHGKASDPIRRALRLLRGQGQHVLADQLDLLRTTGTGSASVTAEPAGLLSAHERRLVTMAIGGRTNADMAREFTVSRRAIEFHFTQIYRKLGIARRAQLHQAVERLQA